jgi:hypothetical protein
MTPRCFSFATAWMGACIAPLVSQADPIPVTTESELSRQFHNPPHSAKPSGYWWWLYNHVDKASITRDLEEFHDKGIGAVLLVCSGTTLQGPQHFKGTLPLPGVNHGYNDPPQFGVKKQLKVPMKEADYDRKGKKKDLRLLPSDLHGPVRLMKRQ